MTALVLLSALVFTASLRGKLFAAMVKVELEAPLDTAKVNMKKVH